MNLDLILLDKTSRDQELRNILALIALQLNHLAQLFILHHVAVAAKLLLQIFQNLLVAEFLPQPLNSRQAFLSIPLLDSNMNILLGSAGVLGLSKRIKSRWNLDV